MGETVKACSTLHFWLLSDTSEGSLAPWVTYFSLRLSTFLVVIQHRHCKWPSRVKLVLKLVQWILKILWCFHLCECAGGAKASWCPMCRSKHPHISSAPLQSGTAAQTQESKWGAAFFHCVLVRGESVSIVQREERKKSLWGRACGLGFALRS